MFLSRFQNPYHTTLTYRRAGQNAAPYVPTGKGPRLAALPNGLTWNYTTEEPQGSVFNSGGHSSHHDYKMPSFTGSIYPVSSSADWNSVIVNLRNGTIVDGDVIELSQSLVLTNPATLPDRGGWVPTHRGGNGGFVQIRSSGHNNLPAYSSASWNRDNRYRERDHKQYTATIMGTVTNRGVLQFGTGSGGYWLTGLDLFASTSAHSSTLMSAIPFANNNYVTPGTSSLVSHVVFDRCGFRSSKGHTFTYFMDGYYLGLYHCSLDPAIRAQAEPKAVAVTIAPGPLAIKGNSLSGWGMHFFIGGHQPPTAFAHVNASDVDVSYNYCWNHPTTSV